MHRAFSIFILGFYEALYHLASHVSTMISEATKRRLERQYHPSQPLGENVPHDGNNAISPFQRNLPERHPRSPPTSADTADGTHREHRNLPTRAVTNENLDEAYVDFIMYCNPSVALETDTTELRKIFRAPPKSDSKTFSTFALFELIRKLELKEIKTWAQLAIDLGVEPPSLEKGQSAQKVQQYAVRLKVSAQRPRSRRNQIYFDHLDHHRCVLD